MIWHYLYTWCLRSLSLVRLSTWFCLSLSARPEKRRKKLIIARNDAYKSELVSRESSLFSPSFHRCFHLDLFPFFKLCRCLPLGLWNQAFYLLLNPLHSQTSWQKGQGCSESLGMDSALTFAAEWGSLCLLFVKSSLQFCFWQLSRLRMTKTF